MSVTIKQIAERTGLSVPTVGNVLGAAASRYSEKTRKRVMEAVQSMGYRPNASARAMRTGRIGCAALVLSRSHLRVLSHLPAGLLDGLDAGLSGHNMHLTVSLLSDDELTTDDFAPKVLREYIADGMIVNYTHRIPTRMLKLIHDHHTPAIWLNAKMEADCVHPDDFAGAHAATMALIDRGHRQIAMIHLISANVYPGLSFEQAREQLHYSVNDRITGYSTAMKAAGLLPNIKCEDRFVGDADAIPLCKSLLADRERPTAVILYSENEIPPLVFAARDLGLSIPRDLTVLLFCEADRNLADTPLCAIRIPTEATGLCAARMFLQKLQTPEEPCLPQRVSYPELPPDAIAVPVPVTARRAARRRRR